MAALRIRLCGVNSLDMNSLRSMLQLSDKRLHSEWTIASSGRVDLYLYSDETAESLALFQQHKHGISAVLSSQAISPIATDLHIKKPLRATQLVETLNDAEQKIAFARQADKVATIQAKSRSPNSETQTSPSKPLSQTTKSTRTLLSTISKHLGKKKAPAADLPPLSFYTLATTMSSSQSPLEPNALSASIATLSRENDILLQALLDKLIPLNRRPVSKDTRLALLECFQKPVHDLVFGRNTATVKLEISQPIAFESRIEQLNLLLEELTLGYKTIVMEAYRQGHRPAADDGFLFAIIRCAELISLSVIHAFRYYSVTPPGAIHDLHQLYLYCEAGQVLTKKSALKAGHTKKPFLHFYNQLMLTGIADPYSLDKYDVFRLYNLMAKMADKVEINALTPHHQIADNTSILTHYFGIDCTSDRLPIPLHHISQVKRQLAETRMINPQGVLLSIEQLFQTAASITGKVVFDLDIQLLKRVLPQFNANYQRQFQRLTSVPARQILLADGITAIHQYIDQAQSNAVIEWTVGNQGSGGMMLQCDKAQTKAFNIGDLLGIFERDLPPRLATIRWLQIDRNAIVHIGLQIRPGTPSLIHLTPEGKTTVSAGLLLPEMKDINQAQTLIVAKGIYTSQRTLRVKDAEKTYTIVAEKLIEDTLDYQQFSFKLKTSPN